MEIIAHRGASFDAPENTLSSLRLGYQQNADACELDVQLTRDGCVVVFHDEHTARLAGAANRVLERTFAELRQLEIGQWGRWKGKGFSEKIPALEEALALIPNGERLFIEIKGGPEVLPPLAKVLEASGKNPQQTALLGFDYDTMKAAKIRLADHAVYWVVEAGTAGKGYPPAQELIRKARAARFDGLDLEKGFPINWAFAEMVHQAGLKLYTWTVDNVRTARKIAAAGVDGITTNRPGWLREQLAK
jgi:glycerophosphoryl diester phosphodiesterase